MGNKITEFQQVDIVKLNNEELLEYKAKLMDYGSVVRRDMQLAQREYSAILYLLKYRYETLQRDVAENKILDILEEKSEQRELLEILDDAINKRKEQASPGITFN